MTQELPAGLIEKLAAIDSPTICNAIEPFKVRGRHDGYLGPEIGCYFPEMDPVCGYAVTCTVRSIADDGDQRIEMRLKFFEALEAAPKPAICVFKDVSDSPGRASQWGEVYTTAVKSFGAIGVVTDGVIRDLAEIAEIGGVQFFAAGTCVSHGQMATVAVNEPVQISGCWINPGDILHGDRNGVTKIPHEIADQLPGAVEDVRKREGEMLAKFKPGMTTEDLRKIWAYR
ncbi:MAG: RraA family protein [Chloroflexi bacterium]|nr:RraA family protein [Chloroflexota bacterium]MDE2702811.1 RraA family protein [Chloroflexota bacterium]MDE2862576.1 RraA family protein [Chloroflexota bacterium]MDE2936332.1 RraA family protein [Chloroflexota bacterium]MXW27452.1 RraA family protein [Chloroflexota bacterium]